MNKNIKYFDMFAGVGGFRSGLYFVDMNAAPKVTHVARCITARTDAPAFVSYMEGVIDAAYKVGAISKEEYEELFDDYVNLFIICHSPKDIARMSIKEQISSVKKFIESKQQVRKMSDEEIDAFLKGELV